MIDSAVADADDDIVSSRRSLLGTGVLGAGVLGAALALGVAQPASATTAPLSPDDLALAEYAIGLELAVRDLYDEAISSGVEGSAWPILRQQHASYAERIAGLVAVSANARNEDVFAANSAAFAGGSPANAAFPVENTAAATHTALLGLVQDVKLAEIIAAIRSDGITPRRLPRRPVGPWQQLRRPVQQPGSPAAPGGLIVNRSPLPAGTVSRRELLRTGGLVVALGTLVAACGSERGGPTEPGRLGVAPPLPTLPEAKITDIGLLRTGQSLEYTALAVYEAAGATGGLTADETALAGRFVEDHTRHAAAFGGLITAAGGEEFACANPYLMDRVVNPVLAALEGTDDLHRDLLNIAHALEQLAGETYQAFVVSLTDPALRSAAMQIGGEELRHATVLARAITPKQTFAPSFSGQPEEKNEAGFVVPYGIPSVFGRVSGFELVVGARNEEGARFSIQLQTPAENTIAYEYQSC